MRTVKTRVPYWATTPGGFSIIEAFKKPLKPPEDGWTIRSSVFSKRTVHSRVLRCIGSFVQSVAPRRRQPLSGKPRGILGGKENCDTGDVVRLSEASKRRACDHFLLKVAA